MTYNWNTMVEITVPTGTNGWLYSGEVIINGVKVRFPVGVPTSVPEPAAVLLKKMIELEQEEDANTAKPQNHYVGDVTIPAGKTLTLEKGAKFVDNSGPSEVVILPETEATVDAEADNMAPIMTPLSATPTDGATAEITYNGAKYTSPIVYDEQNAMFAMGNTEPAGIQGGNADAPFFVGLIPEGLEGIYAMVLPLDGATTVTISIVQTEGAASGGEGAGATALIVNLDIATMTIDKPFTAAYSALSAGKPVQFQTRGEAFTHILYPCTYSESYINLFQITHDNYMTPTGLVINSDGTISLRTGD